MTQADSTKRKDKQAMSLLECLGAVQSALSALPDNVVRLPSNLAEAFILVDPVLATLHRQLADAKRNVAHLTNVFGPNDPMAEALQMQIAAIEKAYHDRLAALRKKREDGKAAKKIHNINEFWTEEKRLPEVRGQQEIPGLRRNNGLLWLWMALILQASATSAKGYGLRAA